MVVHGGPDFDHAYFLPELDRLADSFRLVYYDQRGRGRSADGVRAGGRHASRSELDDLDRVRSHFGLESVAVLGHSWGGVLAMEYAIRHPERVSQLDPDGHRLRRRPTTGGSLRESFARRRPAEDQAEMDAIAATDAYARGDLEAEAAYYRAPLQDDAAAAGRPRRARRATQGATSRADGVLLARAIEQRLYEETSGSAGLGPASRRYERSHVPTLVLHGEHDFVPVELAARIAEAVPGARLTVLPGLRPLHLPRGAGAGLRGDLPLCG